jgi:hypothetical protein
MLNKYGRPVFYIYTTTDYTDFSSGVKSLFILCDRLNKNGFEAYVTGKNENGNLWAPTLTSSIIDAHKSSGRLQIAVYPEVVMGNPLLIPNVVRYLLNQPNNFFVNWFGGFYEDEYILHYAEEFAVPWIRSLKTRTITVDQNLFNMPEHCWEERSGFLLYSHRVTDLPLDQIPEWCKPYKVISMKEPVAARDLAKMYKSSRGLILYERSAASVEALLCGCPVIYILDELPTSLNEYGNIGTILGFNKSDYDKTVNTVNLFSKIYISEDMQDLYQFQPTFDKIVSHFRQKKSGLEYVPSIEIELANNEWQAGLYSNAIMRYNKIMSETNNNLEACYRMSLALFKCNKMDLALNMLQKGEQKLLTMPEHKSLSGVRALFYLMMANIGKINNDVDLVERSNKLLTKYYDISALPVNVHKSLLL